MAPPAERDGDTDGFSDSDQAWWDRVTGRGGAQPPAGAAEREGEALRRVLALERQAASFDDAPEADLDPAGRDARWQRARARLQQEGLLEAPSRWWHFMRLKGMGALLEIPNRWQRAGWGAALAAGLLAAVVLVTPPDDPTIYGEPPVLRSTDIEVLRLPVAGPRADAEALERTLRDADWKAGLYQRRREFVVDTTVDADMPQAARTALVAHGVRTQAGQVRLEFVPR